MARTTDNASASATSANSSITNVAALANVSIATVSRVLSGKRTKDDDIARRVRAAAAHLNYSVNYAASALRSTVTIAKEGGNPVPANSILSVMGLGIKQGDSVVIDVQGADDETVADNLLNILVNAE